MYVFLRLSPGVLATVFSLEKVTVWPPFSLVDFGVDVFYARNHCFPKGSVVPVPRRLSGRTFVSRNDRHLIWAVSSTAKPSPFPTLPQYRRYSLNRILGNLRDIATHGSSNTRHVQRSCCGGGGIGRRSRSRER